MFVDASAIVAILLSETGFDQLADRLRICPRPLTSGVALCEAALAVARRKSDHREAEATVRQFIAVAQIEIVVIDDVISECAIATFWRYGKGRGHPAQLNMGDCFAYACARVHDVPLLFVGDDFTRTDIRPALV